MKESSRTSNSKPIGPLPDRARFIHLKLRTLRSAACFRSRIAGRVNDTCEKVGIGPLKGASLGGETLLAPFRLFGIVAKPGVLLARFQKRKLAVVDMGYCRRKIPLPLGFAHLGGCALDFRDVGLECVVPHR